MFTGNCLPGLLLVSLMLDMKILYLSIFMGGNEMALLCSGNKNNSRVSARNVMKTETKYVFVIIDNNCKTSITVSKECNVVPLSMILH